MISKAEKIMKKKISDEKESNEKWNPIIERLNDLVDLDKLMADLNSSTENIEYVSIISKKYIKQVLIKEFKCSIARYGYIKFNYDFSYEHNLTIYDLFKMGDKVKVAFKVLEKNGYKPYVSIDEIETDSKGFLGIRKKEEYFSIRFE